MLGGRVYPGSLICSFVWAISDEDDFIFEVNNLCCVFVLSLLFETMLDLYKRSFGIASLQR